jgi:hypothetical protein
VAAALAASTAKVAAPPSKPTDGAAALAEHDSGNKGTPQTMVTAHKPLAMTGIA